MFTFLKRWEQAGTEEVYDQNEAARKGRWNELGVDGGGRETTRLWTQRMTQKKKKKHLKAGGQKHIGVICLVNGGSLGGDEPGRQTNDAPSGKVELVVCFRGHVAPTDRPCPAPLVPHCLTPLPCHTPWAAPLTAELLSRLSPGQAP